MPDQTTGTAIRPSHRVRGPALIFDLASETVQLRSEARRRHEDRNTKTLVKEADFSVVLLSMKRDCVIRQHIIAAEVAIQILTGHLRLHVLDEQFDLMARRLLVLDRGVPFSLEAVEESSFLLTVARHALPELTALDLDLEPFAPEARE